MEKDNSLKNLFLMMKNIPYSEIEHLSTPSSKEAYKNLYEFLENRYRYDKEVK